MISSNFNNFFTRLLLSLALALPAYLVLASMQNNLTNITAYAYIEYTLAVFITLLCLFELHQQKSLLLEKHKPWISQTRFRIGAELLLSILLGMALSSSGYSIFYQLVWDMPIYMPSLIFYNVVTVFLSFCMMGFVNTSFLVEKWKLAIKKTEELEKENIKARLSALQSQLSPHFLFNNFNILHALMDEDISIAKKYLVELSDVFRYILNSRHQELVPLIEELGFIKSYQYVLQIRYEGKFRINFDIDPAALATKVPPVSLQVAIENAIKHNEVSALHPLIIDINATEHSISISNRIISKKVGHLSTQTGLDNLRRRYAIITDQPVVIKHDQKLFVITLPLIS